MVEAGRSLPESIGQLENLETLFVGRNQLSSLPETITQLPKLWQVTFGGNPLKLTSRILKWIQENQKEARRLRPDQYTIYRLNFGGYLKR